MGLSILPVSLALICVESALYGIFFVLATTSLAVLVLHHGRKNSKTKASVSFASILRSPLFAATVLLLLTVSAHWIISVRRLFYAFIYNKDRQDPAVFFMTVETSSHVAGAAFVIASVVVGDIILTYRIWVVWARRFTMIVFPMLCTMAYTAMGISVVQLFSTFTPGESIFVPQSQRRIITTAALTLSTNIYGTCSIAYRIWSTNRAVRHDRMQIPSLSILEALVIFVESAALYTFWTLFFLMSYAAQSALESFAFQCIPAATGISFMLIIVRIGLGFSWTEGTSTQVPAPPRPTAGGTAAGRGLREVYPLNGMIMLNVTRTVDVERETDFALPREGDSKRMREEDLEVGKQSQEV